MPIERTQTDIAAFSEQMAAIRKSQVERFDKSEKAARAAMREYLAAVEGTGPFATNAPTLATIASLCRRADAAYSTYLQSLAPANPANLHRSLTQ